MIGPWIDGKSRSRLGPNRSAGDVCQTLQKARLKAGAHVKLGLDDNQFVEKGSHKALNSVIANFVRRRLEKIQSAVVVSPRFTTGRRFRGSAQVRPTDGPLIFRP